MDGPGRLATVAIWMFVALTTPPPPTLAHGDPRLEQAEPAASSSSSSYYLGPEFQVSSSPVPPGADRYQPHVSHNGRHREYLVVWHNTWAGSRDVYARRVSDSGRLLSFFTVSTGPGDRFQPAAAYNAETDEYLVVWMKDVDGTHHEVWGRLVAWNGTYMGPEFQIFTWPDRAFWRPRVVWNGWRNEYLVVTSVYDTYNHGWNDIARRRVMADGTTPYPGGAVWQEPWYQPQQADVVYNIAIDQYLVVWLQKFGFADIWGALLRGDNAGVVEFLAISDIESVKDKNAPAVSTNQQGRYLVVWEEEFVVGDFDILGQELDSEGYHVGDPFSIAWTADNERNAAVAAKPGAGVEYVAVWERTTSTGQALHGKSWGADAVDSSFLVAPAFYWDSASPALAWGGPNYLIAYEGDSLAFPAVRREIFGRMWAPRVVYLPALLKKW